MLVEDWPLPSTCAFSWVSSMSRDTEHKVTLSGPTTYFPVNCRDTTGHLMLPHLGSHALQFEALLVSIFFYIQDFSGRLVWQLIVFEPFPRSFGMAHWKNKTTITEVTLKTTLIYTDTVETAWRFTSGSRNCFFMELTVLQPKVQFKIFFFSNDRFKFKWAVQARFKYFLANFAKMSG